MNNNYNYIIHPFTGKQVKRLTIQNLRQHGFNTIDDFKEQYPNYPICSQEYLDKIKIGSNKMAEISINHGIKRKEKYYKNPKKCLECNIIIPYEKKDTNKNFCCQSCSTIFNNKNRNELIYEKISESNKKTCEEKGLNIRYPHCEVSFINCSECNIPMRKKSGSHLYCDKCKENKIDTYRQLCKFKFTEEQYPDLFDKTLIKQYGWYAPDNSNKPNPNGVVFDHLYRVIDGYRNDIKPNIISHPANARLLTQPENHRIKNESSITLDELYSRIVYWKLSH